MHGEAADAAGWDTALSGVDGEPRPRITGGGGRRWSRRDPHRTAGTAPRVMRQRETAARQRAGARWYACPIDPSVGRLGGRFQDSLAVDADGAFEVRIPESAEPSILRIFGCGLLGYYGVGGFTTQRVDAARLEVAAGETEVEVRLPASVQNLCDSQDPSPGSCVGPTADRPRGSGSITTSSTSGHLSDPTEPSNSASRRPRLRLSSRCNGPAECGWLGYHGPGALTTQRDQAQHIEPRTHVAITLPAAPDQVCDR